MPSIWKNRPRGVPQAQLWIQHRDLSGKLTQTWEQPISSEAKNSAELLSVTIDKPLTEGTLEVYLQNGSKNNVYYWGLNTVKNITKLIEKNADLVADKPNKSARTAGCPDGYLPNGQGQCCNPFTGECVNEGGGGGTPPSTYTKTETRTVTTTTEGGSSGGGGGCPEGYLPNGQGMCCNPFTNDCVPENQSVGVASVCVTTTIFEDIYSCSYSPAYPENGVECTFMYSRVLSSSTTCSGESGGGTGGGGTGGGGSGGGGGGGGGTGSGGPKTCINGRDQAGNPCGASICGTNGFDQYGAKCGRNCNSITGFDQFNDPCGPSICGSGTPESVITSGQARVSSPAPLIDQYGSECASVDFSNLVNEATVLGYGDIDWVSNGKELVWHPGNRLLKPCQTPAFLDYFKAFKDIEHDYESAKKDCLLTYLGGSMSIDAISAISGQLSFQAFSTWWKSTGVFTTSRIGAVRGFFLALSLGNILATACVENKFNDAMYKVSNARTDFDRNKNKDCK